MAQVGQDSVVVARSADVPEGGRIVVAVDTVEVGIFRVSGELFAYENLCAHQGGPACQGLLIHRVVEPLDDEHQSHGDEFSQSDFHVVCPWHGYEYNVRTGEHPADPKIRLRAFAVTEDSGEIRVTF